MSDRPHRPIGGYFELELPESSGHFHAEAARLNSGRSCLAHVLLSEHVEKLYLPYFSCSSLLEPLQYHDLKYEFYRLDRQFEIVDPPMVGAHEKLLYINYYGMKTEYMSILVGRYRSSLIADNTHAFFEAPSEACPCICSPRKYFGVPDGGYLDAHYLPIPVMAPAQDDPGTYLHLMGRIEKGPQAYYSTYKAHEEQMHYDGVRTMSRFSERILSSIDYRRVKSVREANFRLLHELLGDLNRLRLQPASIPGPYCYPLWADSPDLRDKVIGSQVFAPTLWQEVLERLPERGMIEGSFVKNIVPLPVDQRYGQIDMERIAEVVRASL